MSMAINILGQDSTCFVILFVLCNLESSIIHFEEELGNG